MNKLIEKLAEQADEKADAEIKMPGEFHPDWHDVRDKTFVELVLIEVISTIYRSDIGTKKQEKLVSELTHKFGFK